MGPVVRWPGTPPTMAEWGIHVRLRHALSPQRRRWRYLIHRQVPGFPNHDQTEPDQNVADTYIIPANLVLVLPALALTKAPASSRQRATIKSSREICTKFWSGKDGLQQQGKGAKP